MKTSLFTLLLGLLALTATGCHRSNAQGTAATDVSELPWGETDIVAVAFVGYGASFEDFKQTPAFADLKQRYGLPDDISCISRKDEEGEESATDNELYLVIPRDPNASVAINDVPVERLIDPDADVYGPILYKSESGTPFFVRCQSSGGMMNLEMIIVDNNGRQIIYRPQLSTDDGSLVTPGIVNQGEGSVLDITQPLPTSRLPQSVECPEDPITARIAQGRVFLDVQKPFGAVENRTYVLEGITGRCVGLFAGEIGSDKLFFLCLLMDDGGVEAFCPTSISGFNPNSGADFISSGRLPDLKDITGFRQEGDAIQAIDKSGGKHALRPNLLPKPYRSLFHDVDGEEYELRIYPDWRLMFIDGSREGGTIAYYAGQVFQTKADAKSGQYEFRYLMRSHTAFGSGDTNPDIVEKTTPSTASGTFRLITHDGGQTYDLVLLSGPALFRFKPGSPVRFSIVSSYEGQPRWSEE